MGKLFWILGLILIFMSSIVYGEDCDYDIEVLIEGDTFTTNEFEFKLRVNKLDGVSTNFSWILSIEDSDGALVNEYGPYSKQPIAIVRTSNLYTPNLPMGEYKINAGFEVECDDTNLENNNVVYEFEIVGEGGETTTTTSTSTTSTTLADDVTTTTSTTLADDVTTTTSSSTTVPIIGTTTTLEDEPKLIEKLADKFKGDGEKEESFVFNDKSGIYKKIALILLIAISLILNIILILKR